MKTLILGDIHGRWTSAGELYDRAVAEHGTPDLLIQLGDFGFWPRMDRHLVWGRKFDHPCMWIDGNHEDFWTLRGAHLPNWDFDPQTYEPKNLAMWQEMMSQWTYIPRGTIIDGHLFIGGARSIDAMHRVRGWDWFPEENINYRQQSDVFDNIASYGSENIHTVFTHDCPGSFDVKEACIYSKVEIVDSNRKFLQAVLEDARPDRWFFGHYHRKMWKTDLSSKCEWRCVDMSRDDDSPCDYVMVDLPFTQETLDLMVK